MSKEKILAMQKQVTGKLMAAISMLLVSAILMCLTSYAWFILSTAPEVSNLKTTAGANGALEIALQSTNEAGNGRADITSAVGSSHAKNAATVSNTYWGNVVDLTNGYGLDNIQLYPSRLKVNATEVDGKTSYTVDPDSVEVTWTTFPATATATLALYEPEFDGEGNLSLGRKVTDNVITHMDADKAYYISAVLYLNGDAVDTAAFSATQGLSMKGALNLQFASSVTLTPMDYDFTAAETKRKDG